VLPALPQFSVFQRGYHFTIASFANVCNIKMHTFAKFGRTAHFDCVNGGNPMAA
jgi:hypothetical protein